MTDDVLEGLGVADGELEGEYTSNAVAEERGLLLAHGFGDGDDVADLLRWVHGLGRSDLACGVLAPVEGYDCEVRGEMRHVQVEFSSAASGAGDHG